MGQIEDAILGTFVDCSSWGATDRPTHPLRVAGIVPEPSFEEGWFDLHTGNAGRAALGWIDRATGDFFTARDRTRVPYASWCGGSVERGVETLGRCTG